MITRVETWIARREAAGWFNTPHRHHLQYQLAETQRMWGYDSIQAYVLLFALARSAWDERYVIDTRHYTSL